jgi:4-alpha-glucanotransferase
VALRHATGLPGMKILQFAYGHDANNVNLPHHYPRNSVAYTGTHDNNTTRGWLESLSPEDRTRVDTYFQLDGQRSAWPIIRAALATVSRLAVIPMQDLLDLPAPAVLNRPGTTIGNWQWRFTPEQLDRLRQAKGATLRQWIERYDHTGNRELRDYSEPPERSGR